MVNYVSKYGSKLDPSSASVDFGVIAQYIALYYNSTNDTLELCADFDVVLVSISSHFQVAITILISRQTNYNATNYSLIGKEFQDYRGFSVTIPNTTKEFREQPSDNYPIRTIDYDYIDYRSEEIRIATAEVTTICLSAILPIFDNFLRQKLRYFPNKLWNGTVHPTEVSQYAILSYFHLPVTVKINPKVKV